MYLEKNDRNKMNGFMFDNYRYAVSSAKLQPLSEHSKIDLESGKVGFLNIQIDCVLFERVSISCRIFEELRDAVQNRTDDL